MGLGGRIHAADGLDHWPAGRKTLSVVCPSGERCYCLRNSVTI